jgi:hypothetical protein
VPDDPPGQYGNPGADRRSTGEPRLGVVDALDG